MDMSQINAAIEGEKQRAQFAKIDTSLAEILTMVKSLTEQVAILTAKRNGPSLDELAAKYEVGEAGSEAIMPLERTTEGRLKTAKRLGEKTTQE